MEWFFNLEVPRTMTSFFVMVSFVVGCCIGSFLNVCIWRIPRGESILWPPSHCPKCGHQIKPWENIPLISYLCLLGKCSKCGLPISPRYFLVELLTGMLFAMLTLKGCLQNYPPGLILLYFVLTGLAVCVAFTDCDLRIIPDEFSYAGIAFGLLTAALFPPQVGAKTVWFALGVSAGSVLFYTLFLGGSALLMKKLLKREALGWGDVKWTAAIAAWTGPFGTAVILLTASLLGLLILPIRRLCRKKRRNRGFAFGPFLTVGLGIWIFFSSWIIRLILPYLN